MNKQLAQLIVAIKESKIATEEEKTLDMNQLLCVIQSYCNYSNNVVSEDYELRVALFHAQDAEAVRYARERIDSKRKSSHDAAIMYTRSIDRMCDFYGVEPFYGKELSENTNDRMALAEFIGEFMRDEFDKGIHNLQKEYSDELAFKNIVSGSEITRKEQELSELDKSDLADLGFDRDNR